MSYGGEHSFWPCPGAPVGDLVGALAGALESANGHYPFLLHVAVQTGHQGFKAKVSFRQFFLNHGRDNHRYKTLIIVEGQETLENPTLV